MKASDSISQDTYDKASRDRLEETCEWLFKRAEFKTWVDKDSPRPVFWLNGKHGAGKTVLCAAAIRHLSNESMPSSGEHASAPKSKGSSSRNIVRLFLSKDEYIPTRLLLGTIATQLIDELIKVADDVLPASVEPFLEVKNDDTEKLWNLIKSILLELPLTYILIDGLDEVQYAEVSKRKGSTRTTDLLKELQFFVEFLIQVARDNPSQVRVWLSSQPLPDISESVCNPEWTGAVGVVQLTTDDTQQDIRKYLVKEFQALNKSTSLAHLFFNLTLHSEVEGSFLWASTMVKGFENEVENDDDLMYLAKRGLPLQMSDVYEMVMERIIIWDKRPRNPPLWK